jgi:hypothetical protein
MCFKEPDSNLKKILEPFRKKLMQILGEWLPVVY